MSFKRNNMPHLEYFLIPTGNQALQATGNLSTTGNAVNLANGQLGVMCATHDSNLPGLNWGDFLPASTSALDVDAIKLVGGTSYSSNTTNVRGWDIRRGFNQTPVLHRNKIRSFTARLSTVPTYHSDIFYGFDAAVAADLTQYKMYIEMRSVRNDRDYGRNVDTLPITYQSPEYTAVASITQPTAHLLANLVHKVNLQSQAVSTSPKYASKGNKPVIGFGLDISGGAGTALGTIQCGDVIPVIVTSRNGTTITNNFIADAAFVETVNDWINGASTLTAASTIELVNISTAGTAGTPAIDSFIIMGLDNEIAEAYDDIYSTKVRTDVELADGLRIDPLFTTVQLSEAYDGGSSGRQWRIRYDTRGFGGQYTLQLTGHKDNFIDIPSGIDETLDYSCFIIDHYDNENSLTDNQQTQKRIVILMPTTCTCVEAGVNGVYDVVALAPNDGDTITLGSTVFENDSAVDGVAGANTGYDGTAADFATTVEATIAGTSASVSGNVVTIKSCVNDQPTTVTGLNTILGYWLDSAREYGNAFQVNLDSAMTTLLPPDGSSDPSGMDLGTGVYFE